MHGDKVHAAVLKARPRNPAVTVHRVHPDTVDLGEVIVQRRVPVHDSDDVPTLSARVLAVEHEAIVEAIRSSCPRRRRSASQRRRARPCEW